MKFALLALFATAACAQPYELSLVFNGGPEARAYRGWPLILRGVAVLTDDNEEASAALDAESLSLAVYSAEGEMVELPVRLVTSLDSPRVLNGDEQSAEVVWVLAGSLELGAGRYAARFAWGEAEAAIIEFEVTEPPEEPSLEERIRLARLRGEAEVLAGNAQGALDVLNAALDEEPRSISLLIRKAIAEEELGQLHEALSTVLTALDLFEKQQPGASHPPYAILAIRSRLFSKLLGEM